MENKLRKQHLIRNKNVVIVHVGHGSGASARVRGARAERRRREMLYPKAGGRRWGGGGAGWKGAYYNGRWHGFGSDYYDGGGGARKIPTRQNGQNDNNRLPPPNLPYRAGVPLASVVPFSGQGTVLGSAPAASLRYTRDELNPVMRPFHSHEARMAFEAQLAQERESQRNAERYARSRSLYETQRERMRSLQTNYDQQSRTLHEMAQRLNQEINQFYRPGRQGPRPVGLNEQQQRIHDLLPEIERTRLAGENMFPVDALG